MGLDHVGLSGVSRATVDNLVGEITPEMYVGAERILVRYAEIVRNLQWYTNQRLHTDNVNRAILQGFLHEMEIQAPRRAINVRQERGNLFFGANLFVALSTPYSPLLLTAFTAGTVYKITTDTALTLMQFLRYQTQPETITLDFLRALHPLFEVAFAPDEQGVERGRSLGMALATTLSESIQEAVFPDPLRPDGILAFGPSGQQLIRSSQEAGVEIVSHTASLIMVPWALGTFIGPLVFDIGLTLLGLLVPGGQLATALRSVPQLRRISDVVDHFVDAGRLAARMERHLDAVPDAPNHRGTGRAARLVNGERELPGSEATGPQGSRPTQSGPRVPENSRPQQAATSATAPPLPPAFRNIHEAMRRLLHAAETGEEIVEGDLRIARALRDVVQRQRRSGQIPEELIGGFLEMERQIDVVEAVSHRRQLAANGARIFALGETPANIMIGEAGEEIARRILIDRGYRNVMAMINRRNNGIDLVGIDRRGRVRFFEIKASRGDQAPALSPAQRNARSFILSRLGQIANRRGTYASASDGTVATARALMNRVEQQRYVGGAIFEITHVFDSSQIRIRVKPWRGQIRPRGAGWWARLFRRMGLPTR